jgi:O-6-methylguanine DNA methyltransferase
LNIPYGSTISYLQQAAALNNPLAVRAVANANGMNRISIIIPCHRVIGSNGSLTGYGGGLHRKKWLLERERKYSGTSLNNTLF